MPGLVCHPEPPAHRVVCGCGVSRRGVFAGLADGGRHPVGRRRQHGGQGGPD